MIFLRNVLLVSCVILVTGCATTTTRVNNRAGRPSVYEDVNGPGRVQGIGVESQDIASMTDQMMRDMLSTPSLAARKVAPYIIVDDKYFVNESATRINKRLITERLMINLNRASMGRMVFVERAAAGMVEHERALKRSGTVSGATTGQTAKTAGADFRLTGKIMSQDSVSYDTGFKARYNMITFKMIDLETGIVVWSNMYEFKKSSAEDVIYR